ncbi:MAG: dicarboxylate/amino acid:cation symporter [Spirochaetia bacterium]|nr:dicarboxylate/amino acid:cation symporter [Spirochaetia bacterium]
MVPGAVKLPLEGITMFLTIDWLQDRFRTTINVWGDAIGAGVIDKLFLMKKHSNKILLKIHSVI